MSNRKERVKQNLLQQLSTVKGLTFDELINRTSIINLFWLSKALRELVAEGHVYEWNQHGAMTYYKKQPLLNE